MDNITRSVFFNNYVDDDAFGIVGCTPKQLMTHVSHTAAAVARVFLRHGLALNFKPNKTELLVCMNGPGSKKAMSDLIITSDSKVTIPGPSISPGAPDVSLRACAWYRHMGICCSPSAKGFSREAKARSGAMFAALKDIRRRVVRNPRLETSTRLGLCESLLFSQLFYASSLWHNEPAGAVTSINHAYLAPLREVMQMRNVDEDGVAKQSCDRTSNAQVLVAAQLPTALGRARAARIKYWCRLTRQAPPLLVHLALSCWQVPSTWSYEVAADLRRIWAQGGHRVQGLPDPMIEPRPWMEAVRLNDNGFNKMLVRTVLTWHNPSVGPAVVGAQAEQLEQTCPECSRVFASWNRLCAHRACRHGYFHPIRKFVHGTKCQHCQVEHHSYRRLFHHLRYVPKCAEWAQNNLAPLPDEVVHAQMAADRVGHRCRDSKLLSKPCVRSK